MVSLRRAAAVTALALPELALGVAWAGGAPRLLVAFAQLLLLLAAGLLAGVSSWRTARRGYLREVHENGVRAERTRLSAQMHDLLGHRLALVALQAGSLQLQTQGAARQTAAELRAGVDRAIAELAETIAVLGEAHPEGPAGVPSLSALLAHARAAGMTITLEGGLDDELPDAVRQLALGVIREGLTNATRHAPARTVTLQVAVDQGTLTVRITNPTPTPSPSPGSGTGLATLRRRLEALGGRLTSDLGGSRFTLVATLPVRPCAPLVPSARRLASPTEVLVRKAWAPVLAVAAAVFVFYLWASAGATLEPTQFAALRLGQPVQALPAREAPVRLLPAPPPPGGSACRQYTEGSFPLAYATFQICVRGGTVTSTTDLRRERPW